MYKAGVFGREMREIVLLSHGAVGKKEDPKADQHSKKCTQKLPEQLRLPELFL